ncbi:immunity 26/phosphotriesterase HocA family protein [Sphingobacterium siyangense]|uniref:immunity 26/phosphotriesterase HocA family protein n=1 Tax=Sphingobacterium siyangense TaxID=459529 RepID=UPI003C74AD38
MPEPLKRQKITEGAILEINIENEYFVYAQILSKGLGYAFFDYRSTDKIEDLNHLLKCKVLFIIGVYDYVITRGLWKKIGTLPIRTELLILPMKFIQDPYDLDRCDLYDPNTGQIIRATKAACENLERVAVWAENHAEERIKDYYLNRPNVWVERLQLK